MDSSMELTFWVELRVMDQLSPHSYDNYRQTQQRLDLGSFFLCPTMPPLASLVHRPSQMNSMRVVLIYIRCTRMTKESCQGNSTQKRGILQDYACRNRTCILLVFLVPAMLTTHDANVPIRKVLTVQEHHLLTKRILWKFDIHILPPLAFFWLASAIDRSNVGNARIAGLEKDLHLVGNNFNIALAVFYVTYVLIELPSNWVIKKFKPNRWLSFIVAAWGVTATFSGFMHSYGDLVVIRMILGVCEGCLLPGILLYLSSIYKRYELQFRIGIFYASASLSGAFGGLLASAILQMDGVKGLAGWRWIFILEGIATVIIAGIAFTLMPADLSTAKFLTEEERKFAIERFRMEVVESPDTILSKHSKHIVGDVEIETRLKKKTMQIVYEEDEKFEWREVIRGLTDLQTWVTGIAYFGLLVCLSSFSLFLPTIVAGMGYHGVHAQLHTVPPYVSAAILTVVVASVADRLKWRGPFILLCLPLTMIGYIIEITANSNRIRYLGVFFIAAGSYPARPGALSILPNNMAGHYKRATATAVQLGISNLGGLVATFIYTNDQSPRYIRAHSIALGFVVMCWILVAINVVYCLWENNARRKGRREGNIEQYQELWDSGKTRAPIGDRHPDFMLTI